jgi:hypothetical protein
MVESERPLPVRVVVKPGATGWLKRLREGVCPMSSICEPSSALILRRRPMPVTAKITLPSEEMAAWVMVAGSVVRVRSVSVAVSSRWTCPSRRVQEAARIVAHLQAGDSHIGGEQKSGCEGAEVQEVEALLLVDDLRSAGIDDQRQGVRDGERRRCRTRFEDIAAIVGIATRVGNGDEGGAVVRDDASAGGGLLNVLREVGRGEVHGRLRARLKVEEGDGDCVVDAGAGAEEDDGAAAARAQAHDAGHAGVSGGGHDLRHQDIGRIGTAAACVGRVEEGDRASGGGLGGEIIGETAHGAGWGVCGKGGGVVRAEEGDAVLLEHIDLAVEGLA